MSSGKAEYGTWINVVDNALVYLSPSSETKKNLACGGTNEAEQMILIAQSCVDAIMEYYVGFL